MKSLFAFPLILLFHFSSLTAQDFSLVGTWQGDKDGIKGKFILDKKGFATLEQNGKEIGGKKYTADGKTLKVVYDVNPTVDPKTIDFIIMEVEGDIEIIRMVGIYKFVNEKTLILNLNTTDKKRPKKFNPEDPDQVVLYRIK